MEWLAFAGSILGGMISGFFTFFGVKMTIKHDKKQKQHEELKKADENKPRLEIICHSDYDLNIDKVSNQLFDVSALVLKINSFKEIDGKAVFEYDYSSSEKEIHCFEFTMKNTGLTEIVDVCLTSYSPKSTGLMDYYSKNLFINNKMINYDAWSSKRYIKPGENIKIRIMISKSTLDNSAVNGSIINIWLRDINGLFWHQPLYVYENETEISRLSSSVEFKNSMDTYKAIECFKKPYMW